MTTILLLIRHGQTAWNRTDRFRGHADLPLDEVGMAQAEATGRYIARFWNPAAVYAGPLSRTMKTAEPTARHFGLPVVAEASLIDVDCGQWQGLTLEEARLRWPEEADQWLHAPEKLRFPGGETLEQARQRAMTFVKTLPARHPEQAVVLVSHTALNRLILLSTLGLGVGQLWSLRQDTCCVNVIEVQQGHFTIVTMNSTAHLSTLEFERDSNEKTATV